MNFVHIVIYVISGIFIVFALLMFWSYRRLRHYGLFVMGFTYGVSAGVALMMMHWWPLVAGFALVWIMKLSGLNPDADLMGPREDRGGTGEK